MKDVGVEVEPIGPHDRAQLVIHTHTPEVVRIAERFGHRAPEDVAEVDHALACVIELKTEAMLGVRVDGIQRLMGAGPVPVPPKLLAADVHPLPDESKRTRWKPSVKELAESIAISATCPPYVAWKCAGGWSRQYIVITIP